MSESPEQRAMATMQQAEKLVQQVQRDLENGQDQLKRLGVNPDKVRDYASKNIPAEAAAQADEQIKKDLAEIDDEVSRAKLSQGIGDSAGKSKRPRSMV